MVQFFCTNEVQKRLLHVHQLHNLNPENVLGKVKRNIDQNMGFIGERGRGSLQWKIMSFSSRQTFEDLSNFKMQEMGILKNTSCMVETFAGHLCHETYLLENGISETTVILFFWRSMDTSLPKLLVLPPTFILSWRNCSWKTKMWHLGKVALSMANQSNFFPTLTVFSYKKKLSKQH